MKKFLTGLLLSLLMLCAASAAFAAEAVDITEFCKLKASSSKFKMSQMTDKKYTTYMYTNEQKNPYVTITADKEHLIGSVYVCFGSLPEKWVVQTSDNGKDWFTAAEGPAYLHAYVELPEPSRYARVLAMTDAKYKLYINEIFVLSEGDCPSWVQVWQPTHEKAELMFISTHPDDELIFFGGAIPTYAAEMQRKVVIAYFTGSNETRTSELLNGLWHMGVRNYPIIGDFRDNKAKSIETAYKNAGKRTKVNEWFVELYRKYKPEVVVTQDIEGEYGHSQHKMVSEAAYNAIALAANEDEYIDLTVAHGVWEVKKFYRHLWPESQIIFDWDVPLASMNGSTGFELASEAYKLYHKTQAGSGYSVDETGREYDNRIFGLVHTTVGEDVQHNDFLENIERDTSGAPQATPAPVEVPRYQELLPELNEKGFLDEGEFLYSSEDEGLWIFIDETSKVIIERKYDPVQPLTWFEADLYTDIEAGEMIRTLWNDETKRDKIRVDAMETAKKRGAVFAMNTDYFTYRVDVDASGRRTGVVVRDGKILYDDPYTEKKANVNGLFPNLDMLAFYPDGTLDVYRSYEITAQEMLDKGAYAVYSFGPYLMKDGEISELAYKNDENTNPRCAIGMVEPGHYVAIMAEGRLKGRSAGITVSYLAKLMRAKGCQVAFNLDGGQTAVMIFMGKQLNQIGEYDGGKTNSRKTCEIMAVGFSDQVGQYEVK